MQRWRTHLFITAYLGVLLFGLLAHAFSYLKLSHPAMYLIVWDMYCGWSAYETRLEVLGEGDSGTYYQLAPGPWGDFIPFGSAERRHYDVFAQFTHQIAAHTLARTEHEPIRRIYIVEKAWAKKYNLPEAIWKLRYREPKPEEPYCYYHVRSIFNDRGECLAKDADWLTTQSNRCVMDNPRLRADMRKGHTFFAADPLSRTGSTIQTVGYETDAR